MDLQDYTTPIVFDSYEKRKNATDMDGNPIKDENTYYAEYGKEQNKHVVFYDGINADQILASSLAKLALNPPSVYDKVSKTTRRLWDGGYLSNTPLRELIQSHRDYWMINDRNILDTSVPPLEIYIVDLHPSIGKDPDNDKDLVDDREHDILFHDRTDYDEKIAYVVSDYIKLAQDLITVIQSNSGLSNQLEEILNNKAKSVSRDGKIRTLRDIMSGRFDIPKVWRIDCPNDDNAIFGKFDDFSYKTIQQLIENGKSDAIISLNTLEILFTLKDLLYPKNIDIDKIYFLMKKPNQWLTAHLYYRQKEQMVGYIKEFIAEVNSLRKLLGENRQSLLSNLSYNILNELTNNNASSIPTGNKPSLQFQSIEGQQYKS